MSATGSGEWYIGTKNNHLTGPGVVLAGLLAALLAYVFVCAPDRPNTGGAGRHNAPVKAAKK